MKIITFENNQTFESVIAFLTEKNLGGFDIFAKDSAKVKKPRESKEKKLTFAAFEDYYEQNKQIYMDFIAECRADHIINNQNIYFSDFTLSKDLIYKTLCYRYFKGVITETDIKLAFELFSKSVNVSLMHFLQVAERQLSHEEILLDFIAIKLGGIPNNSFNREKKGAADILRVVKNMNADLLLVEDVYFWMQHLRKTGKMNYGNSLVSIASAFGNFLNAGLTKDPQTDRYVVNNDEKKAEKARITINKNLLAEKLTNGK